MRVKFTLRGRKSKIVEITMETNKCLLTEYVQSLEFAEHCEKIRELHKHHYIIKIEDVDL